MLETQPLPVASVQTLTTVEQRSRPASGRTRRGRVIALMARNGDLPAVAFQLLVYPVTDLGMTHESYKRVTEGVPLTSRTMDWFIDHYLPGPKDRADWRASPRPTT